MRRTGDQTAAADTLQLFTGAFRFRMMEGVNEVGEVKMEEESEDKRPEHKVEDEKRKNMPHVLTSSVLLPPQECLHTPVHEEENNPMMRAGLTHTHTHTHTVKVEVFDTLFITFTCVRAHAVLCSQVCKVYRFQTKDHRWLQVREQMSETPISFSLPKQLLSVLINEHTVRIQELKDLGEIDEPKWDGLRCDVITHCNLLIGCYQETLTELNRLSGSSCFKSSSSKSDKHLQFVPTNLHSQRMKVTCPDNTGVWYEVITFGAPADHHQSFKHGGLKRLLSKYNDHKESSVSYSLDEISRAREMLTSMAQLQPLVFGLAEELLSVSLELNGDRLRGVLDILRQQTELFVHTVKDELVKKALLEIHSQYSASCNHTCNSLPCDHTTTNQEEPTSVYQRDSSQWDTEYDEEEWDRAWGNVAMSLNCIIALSDRLLGWEEPQLMTPSEQDTRDTNSENAVCSSSSSWQEQLLPLVITLRDCIREAVRKARSAMTFVLLQGAAASTVTQGPAGIVQRRHAVFSQALSAVVCGIMLKLYGVLDQPDFLQQLQSVGILAQFEGLLSTHGNEMGMLEDMEVGVADLSSVGFTVIVAKTEEPEDLLPTLRGTWGCLVVLVPLPLDTFKLLPCELKEGCLIRIHPVLFNIGINQQQSLAERFGNSSMQERLNWQSCQRLRSYCSALREELPHVAANESLSHLLDSLDRSIKARKRKNVEVLWIAAMVCRAANGIRLTSCKSAKDRTAMSVTLEQCLLLREHHMLSQQHFSTALDCMRRDGCRMDNVQKNVGSRKFAFSGVQLLSFPKLYRPPNGSFR